MKKLIILFIFVIIGCFILNCYADEPKKADPAKPEKSKENEQTSEWSKEEKWLQIRITAPAEIEHNLPIKLKIEFQCNPKTLSPETKKLNTYFIDRIFKFRLTNIETKKVIELEICDSGGPPDNGDTGECFILLGGNKIQPFEIHFLTIVRSEELQPGEYECRIQYSYDKGKSHWSGADEDWQKQGFWTGDISSVPLKLKILKETLRTKTIIVPEKIIIDENLKVKYVTKKIECQMRNGFILVLGTKDKQSAGIETGSDENLFRFGVIQDLLNDYKGGDIDISYSFDIFEVPARYFVHKWFPGPDEKGYKSFCKGAIAFHLSEKEIKALIVAYKQKNPPLKPAEPKRPK